MLHTLLFCDTGVLYVVGACDSSDVIWNTVSGYQITSDGNLKEIPVAPMNCTRRNSGVTATRTGLIVCGGYAVSPLKTCEAYYEKNQQVSETHVSFVAKY